MFNEKAILAKWNAEMYDLNEKEIDDVEFALSVIGGTQKKFLRSLAEVDVFLSQWRRLDIWLPGLILMNICSTKFKQNQPK